MDFAEEKTPSVRTCRALRAMAHHGRWRQICLEAIEDHCDLEGFMPLPGLPRIHTAITAAKHMKGSVEHLLLRRAAYHELMALYAMRQAAVGASHRSHVAALREFLGLGREPVDDAASEPPASFHEIPSASDGDSPPSRHPPPGSGRPRVRRMTRTRRTGSRRGGHGSCCLQRAAAATAPLVTAL